MKRLACAMLGATIVAAGLTAPAAAQPSLSRLYSVPLPPPREVLDRLNLQMGWRMYVPMADRTEKGVRNLFRSEKVPETNAVKIACNFLFFLHFRHPGGRGDLLR